MPADAHTVHGTTNDGQYGELRLFPTKNGWLQLGFGATAHLKREYVCGETLQEVLSEWIPYDLFKNKHIRVEETKGARWADM